MNQANITVLTVQDFMPYIASIVCSLIAGITSYCIARKQSKSDINRLEKQFQLDLEKEREKFAMEKEKMEIAHKHQMELQQQEQNSALGEAMMSSIMTEALKNPDIQRQIQSGISSGMRQKEHRKRK